MTSSKTKLEEMWSGQGISGPDIDYDIWAPKRETLQQMSRISHSCIFTVDVYKGIYDFASEKFADIFGFNLSRIRNIGKQGDLIEDRIHPDDHDNMIDIQIRHGQFIYSLPPEKRNDYMNIFQFRMLNAKRKYINVTSRQQVIQKDKKGKAWIIMGMMDISPDQTPLQNVKYTSLHIKTGEIITPSILLNPEINLTKREKEILQFIHQGLLSKEIADKLRVSIYTVNNHRKNILAKLKADNAIEAINNAKDAGLFY